MINISSTFNSSKFKLLKIIIALFALQYSTAVFACNVRDENEIVKSVERFYTIEYEGGRTDRFVYVFSAHFTGCMNQTGRASHFPDHLIDDRACYYSAGSVIVREGFYITGSGARASLGDVRKIYSNPLRRTDFGSSVFGHSTCGDNFGAYDKLKSSIKTSLSSTMDTMLMSDILPDAVKDATTITKGKLVAAQ